ncbi:hypothetical protein [Konateibacter massiliensis]|uniref:hypothetical protein n=1 Tax=Konateibacter massiliensis TaxID=2002841 RepID=UPI0015D51E5F|nr:hypothetical protein [Konateibacter massiliensis]
MDNYTLKNYKITFERSNKSIGYDFFKATSEAEARYNFKECYRHDVYKIISVEQVR